MRRFAAFAVFFASLIAVSVHAGITGNMSASMAQGEKRTFTFEADFGTGVYNGPLTIAISADRGLILGAVTVSASGYSCSTSTRAVVCRGSVNLSPGQKVTITQEVTVGPDAFGTLAWTAQLVGDRLSGRTPSRGTITVTNPRPKVVVTKFPEGIVGRPGVGGFDRFTIKNVGNAATTVSVAVSQGFFTMTGNVALAPGAEESVDVSITTTQAGFFFGSATLTGDGVPPDTVLPLRAVITNDGPTAPPAVSPAANRFDSTADPGSANPTLTIPFTNTGAGEAIGILSTDVSWLRLPNEITRIAPGATKDVAVTIDLARQSAILEASGGSGSLTGTVTLRYITSNTPSGVVRIAADGLPTASSSTTVVSTVSINLATATIPPLSDVHSQLFVPGIGHVQGSVGLFISDLTIYPQVEGDRNVMQYRSIADVDLYFMPLGGGTAKKVSVASLAPPDVVSFGDVVGTVYKESRVGTLHIRAPGFLAGSDVVGVNASVFNVSDPKGTLGTSIPVFKYGAFECPDEATKRIYLTGLRKDTAGHTNFYVQETCGTASSVRLTYLDPAGNALGTTNVDVPAFAAVQVGSAAMPEGAVSAILQRNVGAAGGFVAYATPVDRASGDTWAQVDWPDLRGYNGNIPVLIPVAGATAGANNTYFRTDVSIMNTGSSAGSGTLRFYNRTGEVIDRTVTLNSMQTVSYGDITTNLFGVTTANVGYLTFTPAGGARFVLTSRNYSTPAGSSATFGTAVPTISANEGIGPAELRRIGGVDDVAGTRGATFRSNMGLIETSGKAAKVKVTIYYRHVGTLASSVQGASATIDLAPRQFLLTNLAAAVFGSNRAAAGDLRNVMVEFENVGADGTGVVLPFISSIDNGTGDSTFRIE